MLQTSICGITLNSPFILGSGPLSYGAKGMIRAARAGAGAVVTKTIRDTPAENPFPHMVSAGTGTMINAEKWSDFPGEQWIEKEIPEAKRAGVTVIASIGHTEAEVLHWAGKADRAGADMIELVSYSEPDMIPMVAAARKLTDKPILVKLSPNWRDPLTCAKKSIELGADGLTAMDSVGPVLRIDIRTGKPLVGGPFGHGWLTGGAIKPIVLRHIAELAAQTDKPIIGLGGVMNPEDSVEMLMAGAHAVGICTAPIMKGISYIGKLCTGLETLMKELGASQVSELTGMALPFLTGQENTKAFSFTFAASKCRTCMRCVTVCPYESRTLDAETMNMELDHGTCRYCGMCASVCPTKALTIMTS